MEILWVKTMLTALLKIELLFMFNMCREKQTVNGKFMKRWLRN
jgi:hypothetical protein